MLEDKVSQVHLSIDERKQDRKSECKRFSQLSTLVRVNPILFGTSVSSKKKVVDINELFKSGISS